MLICVCFSTMRGFDFSASKVVLAPKAPVTYPRCPLALQINTEELAKTSDSGSIKEFRMALNVC